MLCDCPWGTYKPIDQGFQSCKHRLGVLAAYELLDRQRRLADFIAADRPVVCPQCDGRAGAYCGVCDGTGLVPFGATREGGAA
jgi:hypothetical protein